jgi:hypothetical protein
MNRQSSRTLPRERLPRSPRQRPRRQPAAASYSCFAGLVGVLRSTSGAMRHRWPGRAIPVRRRPLGVAESPAHLSASRDRRSVASSLRPPHVRECGTGPKADSASCTTFRLRMLGAVPDRCRSVRVFRFRGRNRSAASQFVTDRRPVVARTWGNPPNDHAVSAAVGASNSIHAHCPATGGISTASGRPI